MPRGLPSVLHPVLTPRKGSRSLYTFGPPFLRGAPRAGAGDGGREGPGLVTRHGRLFRHNRNARSKEAGQVSLALAPLGRPWLPHYRCTWQRLKLTAEIHWRPGEESRVLLREHSPVLRAQAGQGVQSSQAPEPAPTSSKGPQARPAPLIHEVQGLSGARSQAPG